MTGKRVRSSSEPTNQVYSSVGVIQLANVLFIAPIYLRLPPILQTLFL